MSRNRHFYGMMALFLLLVLHITPTVAQQNLLQNPGFEGEDYQGLGTARAWVGWFAETPRTEGWMNVKPEYFPNEVPPQVYEGRRAQKIGRGSGTFTGGVWQIVDGIAEGTRLRASAWVFIENTFGREAQVRIGIGSNTGENYLGNVTWSNWLTSVNSWQEVSVEAVVPSGRVTIFIYATQRFPNDPNNVFFDQAALVATGTGAVPALGTGTPSGSAAVVPAATSTPAQALAQRVGVQDTDASDGILHTVQSGDTLAAIAVAYGVPLSRIRELNNLQGGFISVGQQIIIQSPSENTGASSGSSSSSASTTAPTATTASNPAASTATTASVAAAPTTQPTATTEPQPTNTEPPAEPEASATPTQTFTPSPIPASPTPAATVAVTAGITGNPVELKEGVCVLLFDDKDQNRIQGSSEPPLAGGMIALTQPNGEEVASHITTDNTTPFCFEDIGSGNYLITATAPDGYGLTTPASLTVSVQTGIPFRITFGAAEGVETVSVPTPENASVSAAGNETGSDIAPEAPTDFRSVLGLVFIGLAGIVLVGGIGLSLVIRRL
jgi:LysM repeat protein